MPRKSHAEHAEASPFHSEPHPNVIERDIPSESAVNPAPIQPVPVVIETKVYFHRRYNGYVIPMNSAEGGGAAQFRNHCLVTSSPALQNFIEKHRYFGSDIVRIPLERMNEAISQVRKGASPAMVAELLRVK